MLHPEIRDKPLPLSRWTYEATQLKIEITATTRVWPTWLLAVVDSGELELSTFHSCSGVPSCIRGHWELTITFLRLFCSCTFCCDLILPDGCSPINLGSLNCGGAEILPSNSVGEVCGFLVVDVAEILVSSLWPYRGQEAGWTFCWAGVDHSRHCVVEELAAVLVASWWWPWQCASTAFDFLSLGQGSGLLGGPVLHSNLRTLSWMLDWESASSAP